MKICSRCILPATFPGISFDGGGVCSHCQTHACKQRRQHEEKGRYELKFHKMIEQCRGSRGSGGYHLLMAYSGGKDSTYTLLLLTTKYKLRVLALSLDNGFVAPMARQNIEKVTDSLGVDHIMFKPRWNLLKRIFSHAAEHEMYSRKSLERASTICTSCIGLVKAMCLKTAVEKGIPLIGFGWSPGQAPVQSSIMKNNPAFVRAAQEAIVEPMQKVVGDEVVEYFLQERHYAQGADFPYNVHPLAWEEYDEASLVAEIKKLGWAEPEDTDSNSSNCLLNAYANEIHIARYGFHPYVWEIANMVREGCMQRAEGFQKIYGPRSTSLAEAARRRLST